MKRTEAALRRKAGILGIGLGHRRYRRLDSQPSLTGSEPAPSGRASTSGNANDPSGRANTAAIQRPWTDHERDEIGRLGPILQYRWWHLDEPPTHRWRYDMNLLSRRSVLAIAAVVDVALHSRSAPVAAKALAARHKLPARRRKVTHHRPSRQFIVSDQAILASPF